jgi:archaellum component FlaC
MQNANIQQQEETLDSMAESWKRLRTQGEQISNALDEDAELLQRLDDDIERATDVVEIATLKLKRLMKDRKRWKLWVILGMSITLAILVFVLFLL